MVAARRRPGRGKSGLHRAGCWLTASRGDPQESATENRPPMAGPRGPDQVRVKRCGKSAPAPGVTRAARQTPLGARPSVGRLARPMSPGGPHRGMTTHPDSRKGPVDRTPLTGRLTVTPAGQGPVLAFDLRFCRPRTTECYRRLPTVSDPVGSRLGHETDIGRHRRGGSRLTQHR